MSIKEACNLVLQCGSLKSRNNRHIYFKMGKPIKIIKIVNDLLKYYELKNYPINYTGLKKGEKLKKFLLIQKK